MAILFDETVRVVMRYVAAGGSGLENTYFCRCTSAIGVDESAALTVISDWMEDIHDRIQNVMDNNISLGLCNVDVVELQGTYDPDPNINTSKVVTVRNVGFITPGFAPGASGDQYATFVAAVGYADTAIPGVQGRKSWGGLAEGIVGEAVLNSTCLARLVEATAAWIASVPLGILFSPGVLSHREGF